MALQSFEAEAIALSDDELVARAYDLVGKIESDSLAHEFYVCLTELFERLAPQAELNDHIRRYADEREPELELEASRERMVERYAARLESWSPRGGDDA